MVVVVGAGLRLKSFKIVNTEKKKSQNLENLPLVAFKV